jgi:hypothetical protein
VAALAPCALADPIATPLVVAGQDHTVAVAAAALSGLNATADMAQDRVEVRDIYGAVVRVVTRAQMEALGSGSLTAMNFGPKALAFSDSGRLLFIAVRTGVNSPGGPLPEPAGIVYRLDMDTGDLRLFVNLGTSESSFDRMALAHFRGRLYVGTPTSTRAYTAGANTLSPGNPLTSLTQPTSSFAVDREQGLIFALSNGDIRRSSTSASPLVFSVVSSHELATDLAWSDHYGGAGQAGLYIRCAPPTGGTAGPSLRFIPAATARGNPGFNTTGYIADTVATMGVSLGTIAATADGRLLAALTSGSDATFVRDTADTRLSFDAWAADEFAQVVHFGKSLVSPDGEPAGWVIDADVQQGWTRFHPATADAAAWVVMLCLMSEHVGGDPESHEIVGTILRRYAGRAADGIVPLRSVDGIYWHWLDPVTGGEKVGWGDGFATLSTMKIVLAAARAVQMYPGDDDIRASAHAIICGVSNWDAYIRPSQPFPMEFTGALGGGPISVPNDGPFQEGIIFVEQAAAYGGESSQAAFNYWQSRNMLPLSVFVSGRSITTGGFGSFQAAFVSLYSLLTQSSIRQNPSWQEHFRNLRLSNGAWTDDNGPKYNTVFSAGTTRGDWGGYAADSLGNHTGDVTTFTALLAMVAGDGASAAHSPSAVAAYQAYRRGARQTFLGGASFLYRRSQVDQTYQPNSAGLPDVAFGALGLAELLRAGSVSDVLTGEYPSCALLACRADFNEDGSRDPDDLADFITCFFLDVQFPGVCGDADFNTDRFRDPDDLADFITAFFLGC